jgi:hypothetical protein
MYAYEAGVFVENCRALADAARACGAQLTKLPEHAVAIELRGESVAFPIASDDREWALTTPEEAFYAAMLDADGNERESAAVRVAALATLLGGSAVLEGVLRAGGLRESGSRFSR